MKYYSEKLKQFFDTEDACLVAEKVAEEKKSMEKTRLEEVQKLEKKYSEALTKFIEDYGYYKSDLLNCKGSIPFKDLYNLF